MTEAPATPNTDGQAALLDKATQEAARCVTGSEHAGKSSTDTLPEIRVCLVEDQAILRAGLRMLINSVPGMRVVQEVSDIADAIPIGQGSEADIFLLDLSRRRENDLEFLPALVSLSPGARVLVLTHACDVEVQSIAVARGVRGVVLKEHAPEILVRAIRTVDSGDLWLGHSLTRSLIARLSAANVALKKKDQEAQKIASLTPREKEIVRHVAEGLNGERIAERLRISEATVRNHMTSILRKLDLSNKFELAVYALRHGLVDDVSVAS